MGVVKDAIDGKAVGAAVLSAVGSDVDKDPIGGFVGARVGRDSIGAFVRHTITDPPTLSPYIPLAELV
jgi:hypothetical protein